MTQRHEISNHHGVEPSVYYFPFTTICSGILPPFTHHPSPKCHRSARRQDAAQHCKHENANNGQDVVASSTVSSCCPHLSLHCHPANPVFEITISLCARWCNSAAITITTPPLFCVLYRLRRQVRQLFPPG